MRLLLAKDLAFREFHGEDIPDYAIVSHRWGNDEPSHQAFLKYEADFDQISRRPGRGWEKIRQAAWWALQCGIDYLWIDTICINKESSAELTEAINSMYTWYSDAKVCFVFLPDVHNLESCTCGLSSSRIFHAIPKHLGYRPIDRLYIDEESASFRPHQSFYVRELMDSCWFERSW